MTRNVGLAAAVVLALPAGVAAHVVVRPDTSAAGAEERYVMRVPTEGDVATTSVRLEIPDGVTILEIEPAEGVTVEAHRQGDRVVAVTWSTRIPPGEAAAFAFRARNPARAGFLAWKARQTFADGSVAAWIGPAGDRRPASMTRLAAEGSGR